MILEFYNKKFIIYFIILSVNIFTNLLNEKIRKKEYDDELR